MVSVCSLTKKETMHVIYCIFLGIIWINWSFFGTNVKLICIELPLKSNSGDNMYCIEIVFIKD